MSERTLSLVTRRLITDVSVHLSIAAITNMPRPKRRNTMLMRLSTMRMNEPKKPVLRHSRQPTDL